MVPPSQPLLSTWWLQLPGGSCFELCPSSSNFPRSSPLCLGFRVADVERALTAAVEKEAKVGADQGTVDGQLMVYCCLLMVKLICHYWMII